MSDRHDKNSMLPDVARKGDGNPEGKGLNGFLLDWNQSRPVGVVAKPSRQVLAEYFTSMLVLSAGFKFRPAIGVEYYLYWVDEQWSLSLIAPYEWSKERQNGYAGACVLQEDMTWTIDPAEALHEESAVSVAVSEHYDAFVEHLETEQTLEAILPNYLAKLPYYPRLYAAAVSRSLRGTVSLGDLGGTRSRDWLALLPPQRQLLPSPAAD
ncbi:MAG: DUF2452 domain-containing protein [Pseudomonadota bacterium]